MAGSSTHILSKRLHCVAVMHILLVVLLPVETPAIWFHWSRRRDLAGMKTGCALRNSVISDSAKLKVIVVVVVANIVA